MVLLYIFGYMSVIVSVFAALVIGNRFDESGKHHPYWLRGLAIFIGGLTWALILLALATILGYLVNIHRNTLHEGT